MAEPARRVLVLEDSVLVSMAIEAALAERGFETVLAGSLSAAKARLGGSQLLAALLDFQLPDGSSLELARELEDMGCPIAIVSGADGDAVPADFPFTKRFVKPVSAEDLAEWVASLDPSALPVAAPPQT